MYVTGNAIILTKKNFSMIYKKLTAPGIRPKKITADNTAGTVFRCHKSNVDERDLRDFQQVNLVANNSEYTPVIITLLF